MRRLQVPAIVLEDLERVGWNLESGLLKPSLLVDAAHRVHAHANCLAWSTHAQRTPDESGFVHVDQLACESLTKVSWLTTRRSDHLFQHVSLSLYQKCYLCNRYGASIQCVEAGCDRVFHYPCAIVSGCYQDSSNRKILCAQHLDRAPRHCE